MYYFKTWWSNPLQNKLLFIWKCSSIHICVFTRCFSSACTHPFLCLHLDMPSVVLCWSWDAYAGAQQRLNSDGCSLLLVVLLGTENGLQLDLITNVLISSSCHLKMQILSSLTLFASSQPGNPVLRHPDGLLLFRDCLIKIHPLATLTPISQSLPYFVLVLLSTYSST